MKEKVMRKIMLMAALCVALILAFAAVAYSMETPTGSSGIGGVATDDGSDTTTTTLPQPVNEADVEDPATSEDFSASESEYILFAGDHLVSCGDYRVKLTNGEYSLMSKVNNYRAQNGRVRLCVHRKLMRSARYWSDYMRDNYVFGHGCFECRLNYFEYGVSGQRLIHENIAYNNADPGTINTVMDQWKNSSSHNTAMLDPDIREMGVGIKRNADHDVNFFTLDMGRRY